MLTSRLPTLVPRALPRLRQLIGAIPARQVAQRPLPPSAYSKRDQVASNWEELRANPSEWFDNRNRKTNDRQPDFVKRDDRSVAIWVNSQDTPEWFTEVLDELDAARPARQSQPTRGPDARREEELVKWESLRNDPDQWYDNRYRKTNPKAPDFKRKDDKMAALWVDSYNAPEWVPELLAALDARGPRSAPAGDSGDMDSRRAEEQAKWEALRSNPSDWYDNRSRKEPGSRRPDFVHRVDRSAVLWVNSRSAPEWLGDLLAELDSGRPQYRQQQQQQYGEEYQPRYQQQQQSYQQQEYGARGGGDRRVEEQTKWESLRSNPEEWYDNRNRKTNPKAPDFRRKDDKMVALWLNSHNRPSWVDDLCATLDERQAQRGMATSYGNAY
ncbi:hypothetical protein Agub_g13619 [Astrephomene gubernaculifera]|uniref:Uncharacterized protein n=1 Tax=Astrephomene gubernaculifera TaxID=47775 RepID=A0AAD3HRL0_9CHLO|nr:hypothetical protein Agub_g13619 [Astrephomene gubernaculifera]